MKPDSSGVKIPKTPQELAARLSYILSQESELMVGKFMKQHKLQIDEVCLCYKAIGDAMVVYPMKKSDLMKC